MISACKTLLRILAVLSVVCTNRLDRLIDKNTLPFRYRVLLSIGPWRLFPDPKLSRGEKLRKSLERLGPVFVKLGQILSTRRDLLPEDIADALKLLQDRVQPFDEDVAKEIIERALQNTTSELFAEFESKPLASASVAQVHSAKLKNGRNVIVKVIRPDIRKTIDKDIRVMESVAKVVENAWSDGKRLRPTEVVADYKQTILDELDLRREAANASQIRRNFEQSEILYIPEIFWDLVRPNVLVMERIDGIPVAEMGQLHDHKVNLKILAERGVEIFFTQVFRDSFFHADMHPGNIFVSKENPDNPQYLAVDFGIVGTLSPEDQNYLAKNLLAFFNRDYKQVAELHVSSGWVPADTRVDHFEAAIRTVCEPIFEKPLSEISFGHFLVTLFQTAQRFNMEVQPQLVLLQKTLLNIEGLGRQLYPQLDLWTTAKPYLEQWLKNKMAPPTIIKQLSAKLPDWIERSPEIPELVYGAIQHRSNSSSPVSFTAAQTNQAAAKPRIRSWPLKIFGALCIALGASNGFELSFSWISSQPFQTHALLIAGLVLLLK